MEGKTWIELELASLKATIPIAYLCAACDGYGAFEDGRICERCSGLGAVGAIEVQAEQPWRRIGDQDESAPQSRNDWRRRLA